MQDSGILKYFLGIEIARAKAVICLSQRKYAIEVISKSSLSKSKPSAKPMEQNLDLIATSTEYDAMGI